MGLKSCGSFDLLLGHDLLKPEMRKKVRERLQELKPKLLLVCPPCGPFSPLQHLRKHWDTRSWLKQRAQGRILLRYAMVLLGDQLDRGDIGMFEHPKDAESWKDRDVVGIRKRPNMHEVVFDQCRLGLKDRVSKKPHKKGARILVNSECIARRLHKKCMHNHEHEPIMGQVKVDGRWVARSRLAQEYPKPLVNAMIAGFLEDREQRRQCQATNCVYTIEFLDVKDQKKLATMIRRCHENLGHPSQARFISMLKAARANEKCIQIAKGLKCTTCEMVHGPKSHPVAKSQMSSRFNDLVCVDTFEVELPWRKVKMLNIVDAATRYQMCVPLWKGIEVSKTRQAYRRFWKRWAGPPRRLISDGGGEFSLDWADALSRDGTQHEVTAAWSPWQNGMCERHGGSWKQAFQKAILELEPGNRREAEEVMDQITTAHNTLVRVEGLPDGDGAGCQSARP